MVRVSARRRRPRLPWSPRRRSARRAKKARAAARFWARGSFELEASA